VSTGGLNVATMGMLVFVDDKPLTQWARERVAAIAHQYAGRVIVFNACETENAPAATDESDWIEFGVRDCSVDRMHGLAEEFLPTGVPRVLLWVASKTQSDERFVTLAPEMHSILLDSSRTSESADSLRDLVSYSSAHDARIVHDFAYLRLAPWQEIVADFFDEPTFVDDLFDLRRITIASGSDAESYYLLGWLASRLDWEPTVERQFRHRRAGQSIDYAIEREGSARRVRRVTLESSGTRFEAALCEKDSAAVSLEVSGAKKRPDRVAPLHDVDVTSLVERAILHEQGDPVFFDSLTMAGKLLGG
jgi:glucose-6-phosphate dehydrogenase assembly protein OpcA